MKVCSCRSCRLGAASGVGIGGGGGGVEERVADGRAEFLHGVTQSLWTP